MDKPRVTCGISEEYILSASKCPRDWSHMNDLHVSGQHTTVDVGKIRCAGVERTQWVKVVI